MRAIFIAILIIAVLAVAGYFISRPSNKSTNQDNSPVTAVVTNSVSIENFSFSPSNVTISTGQQVTWTNNDSTTHTVMADDGSFQSGQLSPGQSFSQTFNSAGTFNYYCSIHPSMKGRVLVQ